MHVRQIKSKKGLDWFNPDETDAVMYGIIHTIYSIFAHKNWKMYKNIKNDVESIFAAANYLTTKGTRDPYKLLKITNQYRNEFRAAIK